jgi:hypothetical protein
MGPGALTPGAGLPSSLSHRSPYKHYVVLYAADCWWALLGDRAAENGARRGDGEKATFLIYGAYF